MFTHTLDAESYVALLEYRHAAELFRLVDRNRERLRSWLPWVDATTGEEMTHTFISAALEQFAAGQGFHAGLWHQRALAGVIGMHRIDHAHRFTSIGYWLASEAEGKGLMTRACAAVVDHSFEALGLRRVEIRCAVDNKRSRAIPERLGFTLEGTLRDAENLYGTYVDHAVYAMLAADWATERPRASDA